MTGTRPESPGTAGNPGRNVGPADPGCCPGPTDAGRATGILMALLPCSADTARQVLARTAEAAGVGLEEAAWAAAALRGDGPSVPPAVEAALRSAIDRTLAAAPDARAALLPDPYTLRHSLSRFRDLRRRTFADPDDRSVRARYEDAGYTLCVLLGHRAVHHALAAAEHLIAAHRVRSSPGPLHSVHPER